MELTKEQTELLDAIEKDTTIDARYTFENTKPEDADEFMEALDEMASELEVIYYTSAMDYLRENDASLTVSLGIAHDMGLETSNLNSELLATILLQENARIAIADFRDDIEELFFPA